MRRELRPWGAAALAALWLASPKAPARAPEELADLETTSDYAFYTEDARLLARLVDGAAALAGSPQPLERYQYAHAAFRRLQLAVIRHDGPAANAAGAACLKALDGVLEAQPRNAEAYALKAACDGYLATFGGLWSLAQSHRIEGWIERAGGLDGSNPRVRLTRGLVAWFRADPHAAEPGAARRDFVAAAASFDTLSVAAPGEPTWGAADAWLFVGRACASDGDMIGARNAYEKALLIAPEFAAARRALQGLSRPP